MDPSQIPVSNSPLDGSPAAAGVPTVPDASTMMLEMVQAATQAAQAAALSAQSVAKLVAESPSGKGSADSGNAFQAYKLLKHPDSFGSENTDNDAVQWGAWLHGFRTWASVVNPAYEAELIEIEARCSEPCMSMSELPEQTRLRSRQLYGILSTLLKGRPLQVLRLTQSQHGYEVMRVLHQTFQPRTRSRAMAIISAIMATPAFNKQSTIREQVHAFERACAASGKEVSEDIKFSILLRSLPKYLRDHINLSLTEDTTYVQVREQILQFENVTQSWNPSRVQQQLLMPSVPSAGSQATDMEVDAEGSIARLKGKGKDKGKGDKGKGDKGGKGGKYGDKNKGKGNKGKHDSGKGKGDPSSASRSLADVECHYCHKKGHYQRDCRKMRQDQAKRDKAAARVRQVEDSHPPANPSGEASPSAASAAASASSPAKSVKSIRIDLTRNQPESGSLGAIRAVSYQSSPVSSNAVSCPSSPVLSNAVSCQSSPVSSDAVSSSPVLSDAVSSSPVSGHSNQVPGVQCVAFDMTCSDQDGVWTEASDSRVCTVHSPRVADVVVCIDTAADESCAYVQVGTESAHGPRGLVDASGNSMPTRGVRHASLRVGDVEIVDRWVVTGVSQPILATGKLLRRGWRIVGHDSPGGLALVSPDDSACIPLEFQHNTLVCRGAVRAITDAPDASSLVKVSGLLDRLLSEHDYLTEIAPSVHAAKVLSDRYVDLGLFAPQEGLEYRTTLVRRDGSQPWALLELGTPLASLEVPNDLIAPSGAQLEMIVFGHRERLSPEDLGFSMQSPAAGVGEVEAEPPGEMLDEVFGEGSEDAVATEALPQDDAKDDAMLQEALADEPPALPDSITVGEVVLTATSTLSTLRAACKTLGVGKSGSRATVFRRLADRLKTLELAAAARAAEPGDGHAMSRGVVPQQPTEPTPEERRAHEATHCPYAAWCEHCVAFRGRDAAHSEVKNSEDRIPCISFDYGFSSRKEGEPKMTALFVHDAQTGWRECFPVPAKGGICSGMNVLQYLASELCRLIAFLGYSQVVLKSDPEPTCLALQQEVKKLRLGMGLRTVCQQVPEGSHQSNGGAEMCVHTIRQVAGSILSFYEKRTGQTVHSSHPMHSWALRHSAFILNRFQVRPGGLTAFEAAMGRPYRGAVIPYGETVMLFVPQGVKGKPRFVQGQVLGKVMSSDQWIGCTSAGRLVLARTARRLSAEFPPQDHKVLKPIWL